MLRWLGAALILCGGLLTRRTLLENARREQRARVSLAAAFEAMAAEIRLLLTPLPALLRRDWGEETERFFRDIPACLQSGMTLAEAWRRAAGSLPLSTEEREAVASMGLRLGGGEESVCATLSLASAQLREKHRQIEARRMENERLTTSICVSVSLFLTILLL